MTKYIDYDPKKHKGLELYEEVAVKSNGDIDFMIRKAKMLEKDAAKVPWFFYIKVGE